MKSFLKTTKRQKTRVLASTSNKSIEEELEVELRQFEKQKRSLNAVAKCVTDIIGAMTTVEKGWQRLTASIDTLYDSEKEQTSQEVHASKAQSPYEEQASRMKVLQCQKSIILSISSERALRK